MAFVLDPGLTKLGMPLVEWDLSTVYLIEDKRFPWLMLVPRRDGAEELFDFSAKDRATLMEETTRAAKALKDATGAGKINVANLGNAVRQFHIHVVARNTGDAAWPRPVWGSGPAAPYSAAERTELADKLRNLLA